MTNWIRRLFGLTTERERSRWADATPRLQKVSEGATMLQLVKGIRPSKHPQPTRKA